jgi:hypothetical protein
MTMLVEDATAACRRALREGARRPFVSFYLPDEPKPGCSRPGRLDRAFDVEAGDIDERFGDRLPEDVAAAVAALPPGQFPVILSFADELNCVLGMALPDQN